MEASGTLEILIRLLGAALAGALVGYERGAHGRAAGLRTHMLISVGSAITVMVGLFMTEPAYGDPSRIAANVVTGVGFLGAGIIHLKGSNKITGLTTAAAMWATATVGLAFGAGYYALAVSGTILIFLILAFLVHTETRQKRDYLFFIEVEDAYRTNEIFTEIKNMYPLSHSSDVLPSKSGLSGHVGITINIHEPSSDKGASIIENIRRIPGVVFVVKE